MGRLLYDLKVVDQRTIDRYRKEAEKMGKSSFALAWVLDQGTEERSRGVTIDVAMNKFSTDKTNFTILDAPGHQDFIPNMIAGASQADFAVLVIDASTGAFESGLRGQTKEHALLVRSMGVSRIIVAVNKLETVSWSQDRFDEISQQVSAFLSSAGFLLKNIAFIPCSGLHGDNIVRKSTQAELTAWYKGSTLVEELDKSEPVTRALTKPLRLTIGDIFRGGVQNPLSVSGRIESGSLQVGDALLAQPATEKCFIKALEVDSEPAGWAVAGQNITIHLSDIDPVHLKIGDVLCHPANPIKNVKEFTVKVLAFEFLTPMQIDVHRGRLHAPARIREIASLLDKVTGASVGRKRPRIIKPGQLARVIVELETAVPLEAPGRAVLRSGGATVAAGLLE
jgi:elongation factor 1 alpha-like protein